MRLEPWRLAPRSAREGLRIITGSLPWEAESPPPVRLMRGFVLLFAGGLVTLAIVVAVIAVTGDAAPLPGWALVVAVGIAILGLSAYAVAWNVMSGQVATAATAQQAVSGYRVRLLVLVAIAEFPALVAFAVSVITASMVPYAVGCAVAIAVMAHGSPREGDVRALQERMNRRGSPVDLAAALMTPTEA